MILGRYRRRAALMRLGTPRPRADIVAVYFSVYFR